MASEGVEMSGASVGGPHVPPPSSTRAGFIPVPLRNVPAAAFAGIAVYLRNEEAHSEEDAFTLYRSAELPFAEEDHERLRKSGVRHVHVRIADHVRFRQQIESSLPDIVADANRSTSEKAKIVYETSLELVNELLEDADIDAYNTRLDGISRSIATLVLNDRKAFGHVITASRHDFYTATHMVNVGTWMVPLAYELGYHDPDELSAMCQAGLVHDIGKIFVPSDLLNKTEQLNDQDWDRMRRHPLLGWEHLQAMERVPELLRTVCRQHHERMDGTGYPDRLKGDEIHMVSRICAVVDSFDAMTALRPFKSRAKSVSEAIMILRRETPAKYDPDVVAAWLHMLRGVNDRDVAPEPSEGGPFSGDREHRRYRRFPCDCLAHVEVLVKAEDGQWYVIQAFDVNVRNVSRFGLGIISRQPVHKGGHVRVSFTAPRRPPQRVRGRVTRCSPMTDGLYDLGVELILEVKA